MFIHSTLQSSCLALLTWQEGSELNTFLVHAASVEVVKYEANYYFGVYCQEGERHTESKPDFKSKQRLYSIADQTLVSRAD